MKIPVFRPLVAIDEKHVFRTTYWRTLIRIRFRPGWRDEFWEQFEERVVEGIKNEDTGV